MSSDGCALLAVGQDSHARQMMVLWDISGIARGNSGVVREPVGLCAVWLLWCSWIMCKGASCSWMHRVAGGPPAAA